MPNKMLIDASHPEETRVVVTRGNRIEEFDFESRDKKQLRGNIYLARVTRVEPSLQAAFVEYGGNRHGFLAFSEIHPDYYQIPVADRQALIKAEAEAADLEDEEDEERERNRGKRRRGGKGRERSGGSGRGDSDRSARSGNDAADEDGDASETEAARDTDAAEAHDAGLDPVVESGDAPSESASVDLPEDTASDTDETDGDDDTNGPRTMLAAIDTDRVSESVDAGNRSESGNGGLRDDSESRGEVEDVPSSSQSGEDEVESVGAEDALEELPNRRRQMRRQYKIQEVIKRRQILLVQVVKEERGNKGAALTTYLSLAGRYSVLMPNTARGGGISRKITSAQDRKRLKDVVEDLDVPDGMGVILRTAGANRTKAEIKRDYEYLMRLWENVRTLTLQSTAPALVYEEGSLIKRSVRDLYNKDIEEIQVSGDEGYREAKDFMRMLMPSHAKMVQPYKDVVPIFARNGIEAQLDRMLQPQVTLKSGGYIIINQTEALVAIDVNSGRSTKEHSIEDTALHTNLEAAEEVARQLRLRDLAGLIVIDFIDMEENRNNRTVEKRLKDHLKNDRARIQVGRISHFGLMEMSRQRIRASVLDSTMKPCPHCGGTGHVRSDSSVALHVVRAIEEFLIKDARSHITVRTPTATALYVLNHKRRNVTDLEERFGLTITIEADESLGAQHYLITRGLPVERPVVTVVTATPEPAPHDPEDDIVYESDIEDEAAEDEVPTRREPVREAREPREQREPREVAAAGTAEGDDANRGRKRRRRRRRKGGRDREGGEQGAMQPGDAQSSAMVGHDDEDGDDEDAAEATSSEETASDTTTATIAASDSERKKRRRGKRGGKRNRKDAEGNDIPGTDAEDGEAEDGAAEAVAADQDMTEAPAEDALVPSAVETPAAVEEAVEEASVKKRRAPRKTKTKAAVAAAEAAEADTVEAAPAIEVPVAAPVAAPESVAEAAEPAAPARANRRKPSAAVPVEPKVVSTVSAETTEAAPKKGGWWQRKGFF